MVFAWSEFLDIARFLRAQGNCNSISQEAAFRCAISRAYYAAFCHSRCYAVARLQFIPQGEKDHALLRLHLARRGLQNESILLDQMRQWRNNCDYDNPAPVATDANVQTAIFQADQLVSSLQLP
jgi:hypothetical protein